MKKLLSSILLMFILLPLLAFADEAILVEGLKVDDIEYILGKSYH